MSRRGASGADADQGGAINENVSPHWLSARGMARTPSKAEGRSITQTPNRKITGERAWILRNAG